MNLGDWLGIIKVKGGRVGIVVQLLIWFLEFNDNEVKIYGIIEWICMKEIDLFVIMRLIGWNEIWGFKVHHGCRKNLGFVWKFHFMTIRDAFWDFVRVRLNSTSDNYIKIIRIE